MLVAGVGKALTCRFYSAKAAGSASFGRIQGYGSRIGLRAARRRSWILRRSGPATYWRPRPVPCAVRMRQW